MSSLSAAPLCPFHDGAATLDGELPAGAHARFASRNHTSSVAVSSALTLSLTS